MSPLSVTRDHVLAYRIAATGLHRGVAAVRHLSVLDIGFQDTPPGSARLAIATRLRDSGDSLDPMDEAVTAAWTFRLAPHFHRTADLSALAAGLLPLSDEDAVTRMASWAGALKAAKIPGLAALRETTGAVAEVVEAPTDKGTASRLVTERIRPKLTRWCRGCGATHVFEDLFRAAAFQAGMMLDLSRSPIQLVPSRDWPEIPERNNGIQGLIDRYLRILGPAGPAEAAAFLGAKPAIVTPIWPQALREISMDGRASWIPADCLDALRHPPDPPTVRLLPPSDPYLQARDHETLVPDPRRRSAIWKSIGNPGVILAGTEIAGTWRPKVSGSTLALSFTTFDGLASATRSAVEAEAERIAKIRGLRLGPISFSAS